MTAVITVLQLAALISIIWSLFRSNRHATLSGIYYACCQILKCLKDADINVYSKEKMLNFIIEKFPSDEKKVWEAYKNRGEQHGG